MKASLRTSLATLVGSVALLVAPAAFAVGEPCFNDTDCPNPACGGDVCDWNQMNPAFPAATPYTCIAAGSSGKPKGQEGWCTSTNGDANCKCAGVGAKCVGVYCTFTQAKDAPAGSSGSGAGGGSGTAGSTATAGTGTAGTAAKPAPADEGGCSVSVPGGSNTGVAVGLGLLGLGLALARRRRAA
jgi:MYXO-CTERM domain-containing protein